MPKSSISIGEFLAKELGPTDPAAALTLLMYGWIICFRQLPPSIKLDPKFYSPPSQLFLTSTGANHFSLCLSQKQLLTSRAFYTLPRHPPGHSSHMTWLWPVTPIWVSLLKTFTIYPLPCSLISVYWISITQRLLLCLLLLPEPRWCARKPLLPYLGPGHMGKKPLLMIWNIFLLDKFPRSAWGYSGWKFLSQGHFTHLSSAIFFSPSPRNCGPTMLALGSHL